MGYREELFAKRNLGKKDEPKEKKWLKNKSDKKIEEEKQNKLNGTDAAKDQWFEDRRKEMTGLCIFCGEKTEKHNDKLYRNSICHLFPKRKKMFPSIALHPMNFIEACFYGNSHHTNFDTSHPKIDFKAIKKNYPDAWEVIVEKTKVLYMVMTKEERARVPDILLEAIGEN